MAKGGDLEAIRELLDRVMGKLKSTIELERAEITESELDQEIDDVLEHGRGFGAREPHVGVHDRA